MVNRKHLDTFGKDCKFSTTSFKNTMKVFELKIVLTYGQVKIILIIYPKELQRLDQRNDYTPVFILEKFTVAKKATEVPLDEGYIGRPNVHPGAEHLPTFQKVFTPYLRWLTLLE